VIWKEDFGGNESSYPQRAPDPGWQASGKTSYTYETRQSPLLPAVNHYALLKSNTGISSTWSHRDLDDHTSWGDLTRGYFLNFDASDTPGEFYNFEINDLCAGSDLLFSAWLMNINPSTYTNGVLPNIQFIIEDMAGNALSRFYTGNIGRTSAPTWVNYTCRFSVPAGIDRVKVRFMNNQTSSSTAGNDVSIDDIEVRLCAPPVTLTPAKTDTAVCLGSSLIIKGEYTDANGTFGNNLVYQWEKNTGDTNDPSKWIPIDGTSGNSSNGTVSSAYKIDPAAPADEGSYRLAVANATHIGNYNCRAMSDMIHVTLSPACAVDYEVQGMACSTAPITKNVLEDAIIYCSTTPGVRIVTGPKHGTAKVINGSIIEYTGTQSGRDSIQYVITCGNTDSAPAWVYITLHDQSDAFADDIWYFGVNTASSTGKSPGIRFVKDGTGQYIPENASGESNVRSYENSLVVSSPYCDGQVIFYSSHNQLYNSLHEEMKDGDFPGHNSIADGLAACYMDGNKYLFFSVTDEYNAATRGLKAHVIDMNEDNGKGALISTIDVEPAHDYMSETIALIPQAGTTNKYWLVYPYGNNMRVRSVDVSNPGIPSISAPSSPSVPKTGARTYSIEVSRQYDRVAVINWDGTADIFKFKNTDGTLYDRQTVTRILGTAYGVAFSPDGKQLYATGYTGANAGLYQYDISGVAPAKVDSVVYWSQAGQTTKGGGLKLGPDGKIYVTLAHTTKVGVISNPNLTTALTSRYDPAALDMGFTYTGLQFSTGLTKSAVIPCNTNIPPETKEDVENMCISASSRTASFGVLTNDTDADGNDIYLTGANFLNASDNALASLAINPTSDSVILTVKDGVPVSAGHVFEIIYDVKDNGTPASQCATGTLKVTVWRSPTPTIIGATPVCENVATLYLVDVPAGAPGDYTYAWTAINGTIQGASDQRTVSVSWTQAATYELKVEVTHTDSGCTDAHVTSIEVLPQPAPGPPYRVPNRD
jgi:hypothetical protein